MCSSLQKDIRVRGTEKRNYPNLNIKCLPTSISNKLKTTGLLDSNRKSEIRGAIINDVNIRVHNQFRAVTHSTCYG